MADNARRFDGIDDLITTAPGALVGYKADSKTYVVVGRRLSETAHQVLLSGGPADYISGGFMFNGSNNLAIYNVNSGNRFSSFTALSTEDWSLWAVSLGGESAIPRFHKYVYDTDTWSHVDGAGPFWTQGEEDRLASSDGIYFGRRPSGAFNLHADLQAAAVFDGTLSDAAVENLAFDWAEWEALPALAMWRFDQDDAGHQVVDETGQGADQVGWLGTSVVAGLDALQFEPPPPPPDNTLTFDYTGAAVDWVVPEDVTEVQVNLYGAQGGSGTSGVGGEGGTTTGTLSVTPEETLRVRVGGAGAVGFGGGGFNGGGNAGNEFGGAGGGASDIRQGGDTLADRVAVAGGGGGGAHNAFDGGAGGGTTGADGTGTTGGTQAAGGSSGGFISSDGTLGVGADASGGGAGAGGGGLYGGGAGSSTSESGSGGSGYIGGLTSASTEQSGRAGNGQVVIEWPTPGNEIAIEHGLALTLGHSALVHVRPLPEMVIEHGLVLALAQSATVQIEPPPVEFAVSHGLQLAFAHQADLTTPVQVRVNHGLQISIGNQGRIVLGVTWWTGLQHRWGVELLDSANVPLDPQPEVQWEGGDISWSYRVPGGAASRSTQDARVRRTANLTLVGDIVPDVNIMQVRFRPWVELRAGSNDWIRYHLGVFESVMPPMEDDGLVVRRSLNLADKTHRWASETLTEPRVLEFNRNIILFVRESLEADFSETQFDFPATDRVVEEDIVFMPGTSYMEMYNVALQHQGFDPLIADENGAAWTRLASEFSERKPISHYGPGANPILVEGSLDPVLPELPNVLRFVPQRGPSLPEEPIGGEGGADVGANGVHVAKNWDIGPGSINARGYEKTLEVRVEADSQEQLDEIAEAEKQWYFAGGGETFKSHVLLNPRFSDRSIITLLRPRMGLAEAEWVTTSWTFPLRSITSDDDATMAIEAERRLV